MHNFKYSYTTIMNYFFESTCDTIERIARYEYDGVEVAGFLDVYPEADAIRKKCDDCGLAASSIASYFGPENNLSHPSSRVRENAKNYMKKTVDFAANINCPMVIVYPSEYGSLNPLADIEDEKKWGIESLREIAEYALPMDVNLCLEAWNRYDNYLVNTLGEAKKWAIEINMPNLGIQGDTFHLQSEEDDQLQAIRDAGDYLIHMHFSDNTRSAPGTGTKDFVPLLQALKDIDFKGYIAMEVLPKMADFQYFFAVKDYSKFEDEFIEISIKTLKKAEKNVK